MKATLGIALGTAGFVLALLALPALAGTITEREKRDCQGDYHAYCSDYGLGTEGLRACMSRNIKKVSHACVGALVDAGEMTKAQADKLRGKATTSSSKKKTTSKKSTSKKVTSKSTKKKK
jgi:topoisomerase IA-like protein